jgi:hypothetical protein
MDVASLGSQLRSLARTAVRAFVFTWLAMAVGGIVLAVASGDWMPAVDPVYRTLLQVFFAVQFIVVGFYLAMRRGIATALIGGVQQLKLGQRTLDTLFRRFEASDVIDRSADASTPGGEPAPSPSRLDGKLSAALAEERLGRIVSALAFGSVRGGWRRRGILGWTQGALMSAVGAITMARFRKKSHATGQIDAASIRSELETQIDDLLLARLRYTLIAWTAIVVLALLAEVAALVYIANYLAE